MVQRIIQTKRHTSCFIVIPEGSGFVVCRILADNLFTHQSSMYQPLEQHVYAHRSLALGISEQLDRELARLNKYGFSDDELPKDLRGLPDAEE